ncbi:helix-turn-helix domain-containing protein [Paenibacillus oryzisoli]|nr:AraC family transcriptional regulator [Paenibacillus oryzisoli]
MDIPYGLPTKHKISSCEFISIWEVHANDTYHVTKREGFHVPGIFITYEGNGILSQASETNVLQSGTYFIVQEGVPSTYHCQNNDWKFYFINFSSLDMSRFLELPINEVVSSGKIGLAMQKCEHLIDLLIEQQLGYEFTASILLQEILLLFAKERHAATTQQHQELNKIIIYMHKSIDKTIRVDELIAMSGLARTTFFTRFRSRTGLSPSDYMLKLKLESAKVSLETTNLSVKEISTNLQFYDEFHFSKLFKRHYDISPSAFRTK